jgi:DNA-binding NarL/FixJ family response regulator
VNFLRKGERVHVADVETMSAAASAEKQYLQGAALELTDAIREVLEGGTYLTHSVDQGPANLSLRQFSSRDSAPEPTPRQREVIQLLAEGRSMKEIAITLKISTRTVAAHKYAVMELLQFKSNAELVRYAIKRGIISN